MLGKDEALPMLMMAGQPGFSGATYPPAEGFIRLFFRDDWETLNILGDTVGGFPGFA